MANLADDVLGPVKVAPTKTKTKTPKIEALILSTQDTAESLRKLRSRASGGRVANTSSKDVGFWGSLSGNKRIEAYQEKAALLSKRFKSIADDYTSVKGVVTTNCADFVDIRRRILDSAHEYISILITIFGDSITEIAPELFDFSRVQYLDTDKMLSQVEGKQKKIRSLGNKAIAQNREDVSNSLSLGLSAAAKSKSKEDLIGAGIGTAINLAASLAGSHSRANEIGEKYEKMANQVRKSVANIALDLTRIQKINAKLGNVILPLANVYFENVNKVIDPKIAAVRKAIYSDPKLKGLVDKRNKIYEKIEQVNYQIYDSKNAIASYEAQISEYTAGIESRQETVDLGYENFPDRPGRFKVFCSFGSAANDFNSKLDSWWNRYGKKTSEYIDMSVNREIASEDLAEWNNYLSDLESQLEKQRESFNSAKKEIAAIINISDSLKITLLDNLPTIIKLVSLGKEIASYAIDESDVKPRQLANIDSLTLPQQTSANIDSFIAKNSQNLKDALQNEIVRHAAPTKQTGIRSQIAKNADAISQTLVEGTSQILSSMLKLREERIKGEIQKEAYRQQLKQAQKEFDAQMKEINNQTDAILEILSKIHLSENSEQLEDCFKTLIGERYEISDKDICAALQGNQTIEL